MLEKGTMESWTEVITYLVHRTRSAVPSIFLVSYALSRDE
jgi:hypothetical protein